MKKILVSGLINIETTVKINQFPIEYAPIDYQFFGINSSVSGVGYNIAKAIKTLGGNPTFLSLIGQDVYKNVIEHELKSNGIDTKYILPVLEQTAQSGILYDGNKRKIILDLKNIQEIKYPVDKIGNVFSNVDIAVLCNINFSRELLKIAKEKGIIIATDVHIINNINDEYNKDFMEYADILFLSNENIIGNEQEFIHSLIERYNKEIIVIGMGGNGLLMYVREKNDVKQYPAVKTREIISSIGAGDALFSSFIYFYIKTKDPYYSCEKAILFSSYKIGERGAAQGFLTEEELLKLKN
jgi:ribokinase